MFSNPFFQSLNQLRNASFLTRATVKAIDSLVTKPKGAPNGYTLFFKEHYPLLSKQNPNAPVSEIGSQVGAKWNQLSESTKKAYLDKASVARAAAQQKMQIFKDSLTPIQSQALHMIRMHNRARHGLTTRRKLNEDDRAFLESLPTSPTPNGRTAYIAKQLKGTDKPVKVLMAEVNQKWANLSPSEKNHWEHVAKKEQEEFLVAMKKFLKY